MEFMTQEDCMWCVVRLEEVDDGDPNVAGGLVIALHCYVEDGVGDTCVEPAADARVCLLPCQIGETRSRVVEVLEEP